jgi:hypothetical protein
MVKSKTELQKDFMEMLVDDTCAATQLLPMPAAPKEKTLQCLLMEKVSQGATALEAIKQIEITEKYAKEVEKKTRGQAENQEWHRQRVGRLTASCFGPAKSCKTDGSLVQQVLGRSKPVRNQHVEHGIRYEPISGRR